MPIFLEVIIRFMRTAGRYRVLALIGLSILIVLVAAGLFALAEGVGYGTALYWSITTATTVGYGDVTPHNTAGRVIASFVMLTTIPIIGAVFALVAGAAALAQIRRIIGMQTELPKRPYTLVLGDHSVVPRVLAELTRTGDPVVLVAPVTPAPVPASVDVILGDPSVEATLRRGQPRRANRALIASLDDANTLIIAVSLRELAPDLEVYALTESTRVANALRELGIKHTLSIDELVGHTLAKSLETPEAGSLLLQLVDNNRYRLVEQPVKAEFVSRPLSQARATADCLVLGIARGNDVDLGVDDDPILTDGDRLVVLNRLPARAQSHS